jgi:2,3-bisphosphoglycerate-dependent phosphoglycerate mutase
MHARDGQPAESHAGALDVKAPGILRRRRPFLAPFWVAGIAALGSVALLYGISRATLALAAQTTTVIVLRHAEKAVTADEDPVLTEQGRVRADRLAALLGSASIRAVYASEARRTQDTARPLAATLGLPLTVRAARDVEGLLDDIGHRHVGGTVVVVGHSNTVPQIVERLTRGRDRIVVADDEFDRIFIVTVTRFGPPSLVQLRY